MSRKMLAAVIAFVMLAGGWNLACADFDVNGFMVTPADLELIPEGHLGSRLAWESARYEWAFAESYVHADRRDSGEKAGPDVTSPEAEPLCARAILPGDMGFALSWLNGYGPDKVTVTGWDADVWTHPEKAETPLESWEAAYDRVTLRPDRVYQIRGEWGEDPEDEQYGYADYYLVTAQMTEEEMAEEEARREAPFSEADLRYLTVRINGVDYVLGQSTVQDLQAHGWIGDQEPDKVFSLTDDEGYSYIYVKTEQGKPDAPLTEIFAFWAYDSEVEYCAFYDSLAEMGRLQQDDPDNADGDEGDDDGDDDGDWYSLVDWLEDHFFLDTSIEGIYTAVIPLSNGREVCVSSHDSPPSVTLLDPPALHPLKVLGINKESGSYDVKFTDTESIDENQTLQMLLYSTDLYPVEGLFNLKVGDWIEIRGKTVQIQEISELEEGRLDIGYKGEEMEDFFMFRPWYDDPDLCYASSLEDWVPTAYLSYISVDLPLPENFVYVTISAGEEVEHPAEEFLDLLRNNDLQGWNQYNTSITFSNGVPIQVLHSGYPSGPEDEE